MNIDQNSFCTAELLSIHLYDIISENNVSRDCYRRLVRFVNTVIRDNKKLLQGKVPDDISKFNLLISFFFTESSDPKIMHGPAVQNLLVKNSQVKGHVYHVCVHGCKLYNDDSESCEYCHENRFKSVELGVRIPTATIKILSIGDIIAQLLGNEKTRELLRYRADREVDQGITDFFDGENYKDFRDNYNAFQNPDDIAIALYTDGFVNDNKGKMKFTMIHAIVLNYDPCLRYAK